MSNMYDAYYSIIYQDRMHPYPNLHLWWLYAFPNPTVMNIENFLWKLSSSNGISFNHSQRIFMMPYMQTQVHQNLEGKENWAAEKMSTHITLKLMWSYTVLCENDRRNGKNIKASQRRWNYANLQDQNWNEKWHQSWEKKQRHTTLMRRQDTLKRGKSAQRFSAGCWIWLKDNCDCLLC